MTKPLVLGIAVPSAHKWVDHGIDALASWLGERIGVPIERRDALSYVALAEDLREGRTDIAWLPPIVYLKVAALVTPLGSMVRAGHASYEAALVVRASSKVRTVDGLRGLRAGWVDRWSAAGYVLPRVHLALSGIDPRGLFTTEEFYGSHEAAVEALMNDACDVVGTYGHAAAGGSLDSGSWSRVPGADVRVLGAFGAIPPDIIAVRSAVASQVSGTLFMAFKQACAHERTRDYVREVFGCEDVTAGLAPGYDALQKALAMAATRGID